MTLHADDIRVDNDEGRYILLISTPDEDGAFRFDIHDLVLDFYATVQREIRPYVLEAESVRHEVASTVAAARATKDSGDGYDRDDPKHPDWLDTLTDWADDQRKRVREGGA
jgi:hypothetical protein